MMIGRDALMILQGLEALHSQGYVHCDQACQRSSLPFQDFRRAVGTVGSQACRFRFIQGTGHGFF